MASDGSLFCEVVIDPTVTFGWWNDMDPASCSNLKVVGWEPNERLELVINIAGDRCYCIFCCQSLSRSNGALQTK